MNLMSEFDAAAVHLGRSADRLPMDLSKAILDYPALLKAEIPERKRLLPWLPEGGLAMVSAARGLGKTFFGLSLADCVTSGTQFMKWPVTNPTGVLYVDGEMALVEMRDRLKGFVFENPKHPLIVLSHERFYQAFERDLYITERETQEALLRLLDATPGIRLVELDNLSSLSTIREDKSDDWRNALLPFLIACRRRGVAVVLIHHCGRSGEQRGTTAREDHLDVSIKLSKPADHDNQQAYFKVEFTKARSCYGDTVEPFTAKLGTDPQGRLAWSLASIAESNKDRLIALIEDCGKDGISVTEAAKELDVSHPLISKLKAELVKDGVIQDRRARNAPMILAERPGS